MSDQQPEVQQPRYRTWEQIQTSPEFRAMPAIEQDGFRYEWWNRVAPLVYGEELNNPELYSFRYNQVLHSEAIPLVRNEERIITPDTFDLDGFTQVAANPDFAALNYREQQTMKAVWFNRLIAERPELVQELGPEGLNNYYEHLMDRSPEYGSGLYRVGSAENMTGLLTPMREDAEGHTQEVSGATEALGRTLLNGITQALMGATSLVTGPWRAIAGEESGVARALDDIEKERQYWNNRYEADTGMGRFLTQGVPSFVGYLGGIVASPYTILEDVVAGTATVAGAVGAKTVTRAPGLLQHGAAALLHKSPEALATLPSQIAGGALMGAVQGISDALARGEDWNSQIPMDATAGVAFEIVTRVWRNGRLLRMAQAANTSDAMIRQTAGAILNRAPLTPEMETVMSANPRLGELQRELEQIDPNGMILRHMRSPQGVDAQAQALGLKVEWNPEHTAARVLSPEGNLQVEFEGDESAILNNINDYFIFDAPERWAMWAESFPDKNVLEALNTTPGDLKITIGDLVPQSSRATILESLERHGVHTAASYTGIPPRIDPALVEGIRAPKVTQRTGLVPQDQLFRGQGVIAPEDIQHFRTVNESLRTVRLKGAGVGDYVYTDKASGLDFEVEKATEQWVVQTVAGPERVELGYFDTLAEARSAVSGVVNNIRHELNTGAALIDVFGNGSVFRSFDGVFYEPKYGDRSGIQISQYRNGKWQKRFDHYDPTDYNPAGVETMRWLAAEDVRSRTGRTEGDLPPLKKDAPPEVRQRYFDGSSAELPVPEAVRQAEPTRRKAGGEYTDPTPHQSMEEIDYIYHLLRSDKSPAKVGQALGARGIVFEVDDVKANSAIIAQLRAEIKKQVPNEPVFYANKRAKAVLDQQNIPVVALDVPFLDQPHLAGQVLMARPDQLRSIFTNTIRQDIVRKGQATKTAKAYDGSVTEVNARNVVEVQMKVPVGNGELEDVVLFFPSVQSAKNALEQGRYLGNAVGVRRSKHVRFDMWLDDPDTIFNIKRSGAKLPASVDAPNEAIFESYREFLKDMGYQSVKKGPVNFMPYAYTARMAHQHGYMLGKYHGKYVLQDAMGDVLDFKKNTFNDLGSVIRYLQQSPRANAMPSLENGVARSALEEIFGENIPTDPFDPIPAMQSARNRRLGLFEAIRWKVAPAQYVVRHMENLEVVPRINELMQKQFGIDFSPTGMWERILKSQRQTRVFITKAQRELDQVKKGLNAKESNLIFEYIEAINDGGRPVVGGVDYDEALRANTRLRSEVVERMRQEFGQDRMLELTKKAAFYETYLAQLFSMAGMNWDTYVRHYVPHLRKSEFLRTSGGSADIHTSKILSFPDPGKKVVIEMLREGDPRQLVLETDVTRLAETYTHLISRIMYTRPMIAESVEVLKKLQELLKGPGITIRLGDAEQIMDYFAGMLQDIRGVHTGTDQLLKYATTRSMEHMMEEINKAFGTKLKLTKDIDPIGRLISASTGAYLAARPYSIIRNLTQSMVYGSVYGHKWWTRGLDEMLNNPKAMQHLESIGITVGHDVVPVGIGVQTGDNPIGRAITALMGGYKWADSVNRGITYYGMKARVEEAVRLYAAGKINAKQFVAKSGARLFGAGNYNQIRQMINTGKPAQLAISLPDYIARLAVDHTQYLYDRFAQPQMFRRGIGRLFGQFTSWPNNFASFMKNVMLSDSMTMAERAKVFGGILIATGAIAHGFHEAGLRAEGFMPTQMGLMAPGPYAQLMLDLTSAAGGDLQAWERAGRAMSVFVPFIYEGQGLMRAFQAFQDGEIYEGVLHAMSAPVRYDMYPRRQIMPDEFMGWWTEVGQAYVAYQRSGSERLENRSEKIRDLWSIMR